jgi:ribose 1,5-bisphosphokinase PhnN
VHDRAGIAGLIARLRGSGAAEVAIERGDGVLVDALLAAGLTVVVIGSRQVLSGAENAYGFGLSAALVVPMGSAGEAGW